MGRKPIYLVANWKTNPKTLKEAVGLYRSVTRIKFKSRQAVVVCPPAVFISSLKSTTKIKLGAQDVQLAALGAYTGSINIFQLASAGASFAIIGHSERRRAGDTDDVVNQKVLLALKTGFSVILCVGEQERDEAGEYLKTIKHQLDGALRGVKRSQFSKILIAYEPVWAIGDRALKSDTPENFQAVALFIKKILSLSFGPKIALATPVLYGGSVSAKNAASFVEEGQADGLLIGRASLKPDDFQFIASAV